MDNWQRNLAYGTGCLVIGLAVVVFSHTFIELTDRPGFTGYFTLFAFGIAFFSLCFAMNRRFMLKAGRHIWLSYAFSFLIIGPTLFWAFTNSPELSDNPIGGGWDNTLLVFTLVVILAAFLGAFSGSRYGVEKRDEYLARIKEDQEEQMPDDLKRSHDDINKN